MIRARRIVLSPRPRSNSRRALDLQQAQRFVGDVFGEVLHAARVISLVDGVAGVLRSASTAIHAIGRAYAARARTTPKSATKQLDRMLGDHALALGVLQRRWATFVVSTREQVVVALDWTDFDEGDHTTLCAYVATRHRRGTPLAWKAVKKLEFAGERTSTQFARIEQFHEWLPLAVGVTLLADRAFGNQEPEGVLERSGRAKLLWDVRVTHDRAAIPAVVVTKDA